MRPRAALWSLVLISVSAVVPSAQAQTPPDEYRPIIASAVTEFSEGRWAEARALFETAHAVFPNARTLRGMGMCAFEMRLYPGAIRFLDQSLRDSRRRLTEQQRAETHELIGRARTFVGTFQVLTDPPGAELLIDDELPRRGPSGHVVLGVGEHTLLASASGHHPLRRHLMVGGGEDETIRLALVATGLGDPPAAAIGLFVASAATLLLEPFSLGWWIERDGEVVSCGAPPEGFECTNLTTLAEQRDLAAVLSVGLGVGALAIAAAGLIVWLVTESEPRADQVACGGRGLGLACSF